VVIGCTGTSSEARYAFWLPITALIWKLRQQYTPIIFLTVASNVKTHAYGTTIDPPEKIPFARVGERIDDK
jgi:hypothetical protein